MKKGNWKNLLTPKGLGSRASISLFPVLVGASALVTLGACSTSQPTVSEPSFDESTLTQSIDSAFDSQYMASDMAPELLSEDQGAQNMNFAGQGSTENSGAMDSDPLFGTRRAPKIASKPFQKNGRWLNAFYLVRSPSENWESLSDLIYGRNDRSSILKSWNSAAGRLNVGDVIYYNSPLRPDDSADMKVLAADFGLPMESITVNSGDSLSLIGQRIYGNLQTWREIASLNPQITNADLIEPGQVLTLQPSVLNTKAVLDQILMAANEASMKSEEPAMVETETNQITNQDQITQNIETNQAPSEVSVATQAQVETNPSENLLNSNNIMKLAIVIVLISLVLMILRRRSIAKKHAEQSWDQDATKATRISNLNS